jgi:hypothetical protein
MGQKDEKTSTGCRKGAGSLFLYLRATGETKKPKYLFCMNSANLYFPREKKNYKRSIKTLSYFSPFTFRCYGAVPRWENHYRKLSGN